MHRSRPRVRDDQDALLSVVFRFGGFTEPIDADHLPNPAIPPHIQPAKLEPPSARLTGLVSAPSF
jgi:hypothetical protein